MARRTRVRPIVSKSNKAGHSGALAKVRKYFPKVESVEDATQQVHIEVTPRDVSTSKRKAHSECAMAVACKRSLNLDGVIIATSIAYLIKGTEATRYQVPEHLAREVVSFDRGAGFESGEYDLNVPDCKLGTMGGGHGPHRDRATRSKPLVHKHMTHNVRAVLGSDKKR